MGEQESHSSCFHAEVCALVNSSRYIAPGSSASVPQVRRRQSSRFSSNMIPVQVLHEQMTLEVNPPCSMGGKVGS